MVFPLAVNMDMVVSACTLITKELAQRKGAIAWHVENINFYISERMTHPSETQLESSQHGSATLDRSGEL